MTSENEEINDIYILILRMIDSTEKRKNVEEKTARILMIAIFCFLCLLLR